MRIFSLLLLLIVFGAVVILAVQNEESVALTFLGWNTQAQLWMVVAAGYLLGMLSGRMSARALKRSWGHVVEPRRA